MNRPEPLRVNYLCKYVPEPEPRPRACPHVDVYTPTQAMLLLCHALHVTLDVLDVVLADEEPTTVADLCANDIRDALRVMNILELYGTHEGEPIRVSDEYAWLNWQAMPPRPHGWVEVD